jgi:hypothetical protein
VDDDSTSNLLRDYVTPPRASVAAQEPTETVSESVQVPLSQAEQIASSTATPQLDTLASHAAGELQKLIDQGKVPGVPVGTPLKSIVPVTSKPVGK